MGKELKGKDLGVGIYQQKDGYYCARYVNRFGKRKAKRFKKLQECRQWIAEATYIDEHSDLEQAAEIQRIMSEMADKGYKTSTIYQTRIALFNMLEFAKENDVILSNPCKKSVKSDIGKPSDKKEAYLKGRTVNGVSI